MSNWLDIEDLDGAWARLDEEDRSLILMWRAVVAQAIRDMASIDPALAFESVVWLGTDDFRDVCELALLDHESLEKAIRLALETDNPLYRKGATSRLSDLLMGWDGPEQQEEAA